MEQEMTYFISGHRDITRAEFEEFYVPAILSKITRNPDSVRFVIGDYEGVDTMAQDFLAWEHINACYSPYTVTVFHMGNEPMHCASPSFGWVGGYPDDESRDAAMTMVSDADIAWVRPGKEGSGTHQNIMRRQYVQNK